MNESILDSIKELLGPDSSYDVFDKDIILHINSALSDLCQIGVGPDDGFEIIGPSDTWYDFLGNHPDPKLLNNVKTYIYLSVKLVFDPPASGFVVTSLEKRLEKLEWRISVAAEHKTEEES